MHTCPACGATSPVDAAWCGQCFAAFGRVPALAHADAAQAGAGWSTEAAPAAPGPAPLTPAPGVPSLGTGTGTGTGTAPRPPAPPPFAGTVAAGRMLHGRALRLAVVAILVGAVGMGVAWALGRDPGIEPETYIRYAIVITVGVYAVVGALVATQLVPGVRLHWAGRTPALGVLAGAAVGGALGGLMLLMVSASTGHLSPDPRVVTLMSEGDVAHIVVTLFIVCCCAPLVEEVLFRGLVLESMRPRGRVIALATSGVAFAVWHLNPAALRYYALMGILLGAVYLRHGLLGSISAHVAFNGVLAAAALAVVLAPATVVTAGRVSVTVAGGWQSVDADAAQLELTGPSGASLLVIDIPSDNAPSIDTISRRIASGELSAVVPGVDVATTTARRLALPAGPAVAVDVTVGGHRGTCVFLPLPGDAVTVVFASGGSARARDDFPDMLDSLRVG